MSAITLDRDGLEVGQVRVTPRRALLSALAVDRLASLCGAESPTRQLLTARGSFEAIAARLGEPDAEVAQHGRPGDEAPEGPVVPPVGDIDAQLAAAGLLDHGGAPSVEGRAVIQVWETPALTVEVELLLALGRGRTRVRSWHRNCGEWVVCLSTGDGGVFELAWLAAEDWWLELARVAHVDARRTGRAPQFDKALPDVIETPWEMLLATGEAVATRRAELLDQIVSDHQGLTRAGDADGELSPVSDADARVWHEALERASRGRLHVTVAGVGERGRAGVGVVEWVWFHDGWRSLTPCSRDGWNMVRVERRSATDLSRELAVRAAAVCS